LFLAMRCETHKNLTHDDIDKTHSSIVYKHWPDTREIITRTVELCNTWIRLSCNYSRV